MFNHKYIIDRAEQIFSPTESSSRLSIIKKGAYLLKKEYAPFSYKPVTLVNFIILT